MAEDKNSDKGSEKTDKSRNRIIEIAAWVVLIGGILWIASLFIDFSGSATTNNAQVDADMTPVTSRVSGYIKEIRFDAYSPVNAGDTLVLLDDSEYKIKVAPGGAR